MDTSLTPHMDNTVEVIMHAPNNTAMHVKWNINSTAHIMTKRTHLVPLILQQAAIAMQLLSFSFSDFSLGKLQF